MRLDDGAHDGKAHAHAMVLGGKKGSKIFFAASSDTPGPVSAIEISANLPFRIVATVTALSAWVVSDVASNPFRIRLEKTCCNWIGSPLIRRGAPFSLLRRTTWRDLASGARNLSVSAI